jgi:hypothetical protein
VTTRTRQAGVVHPQWKTSETRTQIARPAPSAVTTPPQWRPAALATSGLDVRVARWFTIRGRATPLDANRDRGGAVGASADAAPTGRVPSDKEIRVTTPPKAPVLDGATHRALGVGLYNETWDLIEAEHRTPEQDDEMLERAYASAYHWRFVGHTANRARSHWILARVYAVLGRGEPALHHARRCLAILEAGGEGIEDWDGASAAAAMARALAVSGDPAGAAVWKARAVEAAQAIAGDGDRKAVEADIATLPV